MEKRVILATVLSTLVILAWWMWVSPPGSQMGVAPQTPAVSQQSGQPAGKQPADITENDAIQAPASTDKDQQPVKNTDTVLNFDSFEAVFNSRGARIKNWYIKERGNCLTDLVLYPAAAEFEPENFATFNKANYRVITKTADSVMFSAVVDGVRIIKAYELSNNGLHKLSFQLTNTTGKEKVFPLNIPWGPGIASSVCDHKQETAFMRVIGLTKAGTKEAKIIKLKAESQDIQQYEWVGIDNRYFLAAVLASRDFNTAVVSMDKASEGKRPRINIMSSAIKMPGKTVNITVPFYLGPKMYSDLKKTGHGLAESVDFGFFGSLGKGAFYSLQFLKGITKNYGWAIIVLTIIMQIVLFPLTMKSYQASKAMRVLQPKMKELQATYKSDPKRLNAEMLNLYKSHKVNPLSGCLPMLLQLPIFWALYQTLNSTYELRKAPFVLWINDLSAPDLLFSVQGFPIRVLPLLMGAAMYFQQKLSGVSMDQSQKMMLYMMPVIFTVIFWNFASGLVLYWLINSVLTIAGQYIVMKPKE